jgi:hypothetical protein
MAKKLKILQVASHHLIRAGGAVQMSRLATGLKKKGHQVWCAFNWKGNEIAPGLGTFTPLIEEKIPIYSFRMQRLPKYLHYLKFRRFVREHGFEVIEAHRFRALQFVLRSTAGMKLPALIGNKKNSYSLDREMVRAYASPRIDRIIVNAKVIKDILMREAGVKQENRTQSRQGHSAQPAAVGGGYRQGRAKTEHSAHR